MDWLSWLSKTGLDPPIVYEYSLALARNELRYEDTAYFDHEFLQSMGIGVAKHRLEILKLARRENGPRSISRLFVALGKSTKKSFGKYFGKLVLFHDHDLFSHQNHHHNKHKDLFVRESVVRCNNEHWRGALLRKQKSGCDEDGPELKSRALALSGPLDSRVHERLMAKSLKLSGPLDGKVHERLMYPARSPRLTGPGGPEPGRANERLMIATKRNPRLSGPLDGRAEDRALVNRSPKKSGPLDGRALSPRFVRQFDQNEKVNVVEYDEHSLWTALFQDMKPT